MSEQNDQKKQITPMDLRERVGLTQLEVAIALGKTPGTISNWERQAKKPELTLREVLRLADLYQCSVDELFEAFGSIPVKITLQELQGILYWCELPLSGLIDVLETHGFSDL